MRPRISLAAYKQRVAPAARRATRAALGERFIRTRGLSQGVRSLVFLGYASVVLFLGAQLFMELRDTYLPEVRFRGFDDEQLSVPFPAMIFSALAYALGWAFLLTGASDCRRRVFLPLVGLFIFDLFMFSPFAGEPSGGELVIGEGATLWSFLVVLLIAVPTGLHFVARRSAYWHAVPLLEFIAWLVVALVFLALLFFGEENNGLVAHRLYGAFLILLVAALVFFFVSGLEVADFAVNVVRWTVTLLSNRLPHRVFNALVIPPALISVVFFFFVAYRLELAIYEIYGDLASGNHVDLPGEGFALLALLGVLLLAGSPLFWGLKRILTRCWTTGTARALFAYNIAFYGVVASAWLAITSGKDLTELLLLAVATLPTGLLFVGLLSWDVLNFGVRFANKEGRIMPRTGRVTVYFGFAMLLICFALFFLNLEVASTGKADTFAQEASAVLFATGTVFLGAPYFGWVAWKRRERLIGEYEEDEPPNSSPAESAAERAGRAWATAGILAGVVGGLVDLLVGFPLLTLLAVALGVVGYRKGAKLPGVAAMALGTAASFLPIVYAVTHLE